MKFLLLIFSLSFLSISCILPKAPGKASILKTQEIGEFGTKVYTINNKRTYEENKKISIGKKKKIERNLLFIALEEQYSDLTTQDLTRAYNADSEIRLEDVVWWKFSPKMTGLYNKVVHIAWQEFHKESFVEAITFLEAEELPYDIYFLTHGIPNHITTKRGHKFISYKDLKQIAPDVTKLKFVFMQGCFSNTLVKDFHAMGAHEVLSFEGFNRNFFYIDSFISSYKFHNYNAKRAFEQTNELLEMHLSTDIIYSQIIKGANMTVREYLNTVSLPLYSSLPK